MAECLSSIIRIYYNRRKHNDGQIGRDR